MVQTHVVQESTLDLFLLITLGINGGVSYYAWSNVVNKRVFYFMTVFLLARSNKHVYREGILPIKRNYQRKDSSY